MEGIGGIKGNLEDGMGGKKEESEKKGEGEKKSESEKKRVTRREGNQIESRTWHQPRPSKLDARE